MGSLCAPCSIPLRGAKPVCLCLFPVCLCLLVRLQVLAEMTQLPCEGAAQLAARMAAGQMSEMPMAGVARMHRIGAVWLGEGIFAHPRAVRVRSREDAERAIPTLAGANTPLC